MSPSPSSFQDKDSVSEYTVGWRDIMRMVRSGTSWSGRERNCVFLNTMKAPSASGRFASVSAVSGLDFADDARGLAIVDWDHDGDLDVWFRNRSAPRLRLMQNSVSNAAIRNFVSVRLEGSTCNRDAIGALAWLSVRSEEGRQGRLLRTVQSGDGFLSQSSKWLHFGLDNDVPAGELTVRWPGGREEVFPGVQAGIHYIVKQGSGKLRRWNREHLAEFTASDHEAMPPTAAARIILPALMSMPDVEWRDGDGSKIDSPLRGDRNTLITFWTSSCPNCQKELASFTSESTQFENADLDVIGINLDDLVSTNESPTSSDQSKRFGFTTTPATMDRIQKLQNSLFNMYPPAVVPLSFLLDKQQRMIAIYRGAFDIEVFLGDQTLTELTTEQRRSAAVPLVGTWFTKPASDSEFIELVAKKLYSKDASQAMIYFEDAMENADDATRRDKLQTQLVQSYMKLANESKDGTAAIRNFEHAIRLSTEKARPVIHHELGIYYARQGDYENAQKQLKIALRLRPNYPSARQNLELIRQRQSQRN